MTPDDRKALQRRFKITDEEHRHVIACQNCSAKWAYKRRDGEPMGAGILRLFDHALAHRRDGEGG